MDRIFSVYRLALVVSLLLQHATSCGSMASSVAGSAAAARQWLQLCFSAAVEAVAVWQRQWWQGSMAAAAAARQAARHGRQRGMAGSAAVAAALL